MADFHLTILYDTIPRSFVERRVVDGELQDCVVIPCKSGQLYRTKRGGYFSKYIMKELPQPDIDGATHRLALLYLNQKEIEKAIREGFRKKSERAGKAIPWMKDCKPKDYENTRATDIFVKGAICLDDISKEDITKSPHTGDKFVKSTFKSVTADGTPIFCVGTVALSSIREDDILVNPRTGKKNVPCVLKKLKMSDPFYNTHVLCVTKKDGSEVEIGRFREYKQATETQKRITTAQQQLNPKEIADEKPLPPVEKPLFIDGYKL